MIENTGKYEKLKKELYSKMKASSLSLINDFDTVFNDAFENSYPDFERNYNPSLGHKEINLLYIVVRNEIFTQLNKRKKYTLSFLEDIKGVEKKISTGSEEDIISSIDEKYFYKKECSRHDFVRKFLTNKLSIEDVTDEMLQTLLKSFELHRPLFRVSAWSSESKLDNELIDKLTQPFVSDFNSPQYFKWNDETLFIRLKAWLIFD